MSGKTKEQQTNRGFQWFVYFFVWVSHTKQIKAQTRLQLVLLHPSVGFKTVKSAQQCCWQLNRLLLLSTEDRKWRRGGISLWANCRSLQPEFIPATRPLSQYKERSPTGDPRYAAGPCKSATATNSGVSKKEKNRGVGGTVKGWEGARLLISDLSFSKVSSQSHHNWKLGVCCSIIKWWLMNSNWTSDAY